MSFSQQQLRTFLTELAAQIDGGKTPTPEDIAAAVGIDLDVAREAFHLLADQGLLTGLGSAQAAVVRAQWLAPSIRADLG